MVSLFAMPDSRALCGRCDTEIHNPRLKLSFDKSELDITLNPGEIRICMSTNTAIIVDYNNK